MEANTKPANFNRVMGITPASTNNGSPAVDVGVRPSDAVSSHEQVVRTITTERYVYNQKTHTIEVERTIRSYVARIEWSKDVFDAAMRHNILGELDTYYTFVPDAAGGNGYLMVSDIVDELPISESSIYQAWAEGPSEREDYTKGALMEHFARRLARQVAQIETDKARLRSLQQVTSAPHGDGAGEFTLGSNNEISKLEAAISTQNAAAIKLFARIERGLAVVCKRGAVPVVSRWLVDLPYPLNEITLLNPTHEESTAEHRRRYAAVFRALDDEEDEDGED